MPFHAAINIQNLTAIFLHFITVINSTWGLDFTLTDKRSSIRQNRMQNP